MRQGQPMQMACGQCCLHSAGVMPTARSKQPQELPGTLMVLPEPAFLFFHLQNRFWALMHITCWLKPLSAAEKAPCKASSVKLRTLGIEAEAAPTHMHQCGIRDLYQVFWNLKAHWHSHELCQRLLHPLRPIQTAIDHSGTHETGVPDLRSDQLCQRLGIEAAVAEPKAAVHGVGSQLEGLLPNVQLLLPFCIALPLDQVLDLAPPLHQGANDLRQVE